MIEIFNLKEVPEFFDKIAEHHQGEWAHLNDNESLEGRKQRMQSYLDDNFIPTMYVAVLEKEVIGTAAIIECDLESRADLFPWMASVYVFPEHRMSGYGKLLVKHIMKEAKIHNFDKIYLYTEDAEELYNKLGWKIIGKDKHLGNYITLMEAVL